jgi:hypothetical protein
LKKETKIIIASIITAALLIPSVTFTEASVWIGQYDYKVTTDDPLAQKQTEPDIAESAYSPSTIVEGNNDAYGNNCQIYQSTDGGQTWNHKGDLGKQSTLDDLGDPSVTSDYSGNFYYSCFETPQLGNTNYYVQMGKSSDGSSWSTSAAVGPTTDDIDKPWVAADSNPSTSSQYSNHVYLCWQDLSASPIGVYFKRFVPFDSSSTLIDSTPFSACSIAIGPHGEIYVVYESTGTIRLKRNLHGGDPSYWDPPWPSNGYIVGSYTEFQTPSGYSCTFNGKTYDCVKGYNGVGIRVDNAPTISVDSNGGIHIAWATYGGSSTLGDVMYTNAQTCCSFNTPINLNLNNGATDQWEPAIVVSPVANVVHITAYDRRDDTGNTVYKIWDYTCNYNLPNTNCMSATQWSSTRVTNNGGTNLDGSSYVDDYHGIAGSKYIEAVTAWTDHRDSTASNYDIYANIDPDMIINAYDISGNALNGMAVSVYDSSNNLIGSGYTPYYLSGLPSTGTYIVDFDNYGSNHFTSAGDYPSVTGYTVASWGGQVTVNVQSVSSIYVNGYYGTNSGTSNTLAVASADMNDGTLTGFFIQLDQNGQQINQGYTPVTFSSLSAGTYTVYANSYCNNHVLYSPNRWGDGTTGISDTISLNYNTNIKVYYSTSSC